MIVTDKGKISTIVVSTIAGHSGSGMFPLSLSPSYQKAMMAMRKTRTTKITKSATLYKTVGGFIPSNPLTWGTVMRLKNRSLLNAYSLTNDGIEKCALSMLPALRRGDNVIPSYFPDFSAGIEKTIEETRQAIVIYRNKLGPFFWAIEMNLSCANSRAKAGEDIGKISALMTALTKDHSWLTFIVKAGVIHPYELFEELEFVNCNLIIHTVNSIPYDLIYDGVSPLQKYGGGAVSGPEAFSTAMAYNKGLRPKTRLKMIMGCGVDTMDDVREYLDLGADCVSICTAIRCNTKEAMLMMEIFNG